MLFKRVIFQLVDLYPKKEEEEGGLVLPCRSFRLVHERVSKVLGNVLQPSKGWCRVGVVGGGSVALFVFGKLQGYRKRLTVNVQR